MKMGVRRGILWAISKSLEQSKHGIRHGRRINKLRFSRLVLLLAAIFLFCFAVLGLNMLLQGKVDVHASSAQEVKHVMDQSKQEVKEINTASNQGIKEITVSSDWELKEMFTESNLRSPPKSKHRKQHLPCEIELRQSVDYMMEPAEYMHYTKFSLQYVEKEEAEPKFAGHQTLDERERSFYATDQILPCGFVQGPAGFPSSGFDLNAKDKMYMNACKIVVSSCIFGSSDFLRRPTSRLISDYSKKNVCFVMFVDEQTLSTLVSDGNAPDDRGNVGLWRIVLVKNLPYKDMRRTGKVPKFLSHRLFPSSRYSIWLDSKMRLNTDPMLIIEYFLWRMRSEYAISNHYDRHCVWEEVLQNKRLNKYNHTMIDEQFMFYQSDGLVKFDPTDPNIPLPSYVPEGSFIVRAHTPMSNLFSCLWFNEVDRFTSRDQLSFAYTYLKLRRLNPGRPFHLYMFKDCERRAIVKLFHHRELPPPPPTF